MYNHIFDIKTLFCLSQLTSIQAELNHIWNMDVLHQHYEKKHCFWYLYASTQLVKITI